MTNPEFVLAALRTVSLRIRMIASEVDACGVALKGGLITAEDAIAWCEDVAPGCIALVPPKSVPARKAAA